MKTHHLLAIDSIVARAKLLTRQTKRTRITKNKKKQQQQQKRERIQLDCQTDAHVRTVCVLQRHFGWAPHKN